MLVVHLAHKTGCRRRLCTTNANCETSDEEIAAKVIHAKQISISKKRQKTWTHRSYIVLSEGRVARIDHNHEFDSAVRHVTVSKPINSANQSVRPELASVISLSLTSYNIRSSTTSRCTGLWNLALELCRWNTSPRQCRGRRGRDTAAPALCPCRTWR